MKYDIIHEAYNQKGDIGYEELKYNDDKSKAMISKDYENAMNKISKGKHKNFYKFYLSSDDKTQKTLDSKIQKFPVLVFDYIDVTQRLFNEHRLSEMPKNPAILDDKNLAKTFFKVKREVLVNSILKFRAPEILQNKKNELIDELNKKQGFFSKMIESIFGPSNDKHIAIFDIQNIKTEEGLEKFKLKQAKKDLIAEIERPISGGFWQTLKHLMIGGVSEETKRQISEVQKISSMKEFQNYKSEYDKKSFGLTGTKLATFDNSNQSKEKVKEIKELEMKLLSNDPLLKSQKMQQQKIK